MRLIVHLALLLLSAPAWAWPVDGVRLSRAPGGQQGPGAMVPDGAGGAYISWSDFRDYATTGTDAYLQHVLADGTIAPGWPADGRLISNAPWVQGVYEMTSDGSGGVLLVIEDASVDEGDLYLMRILADGSMAPGWPEGGVPIAVVGGSQTLAKIAWDGAGGAFVSWRDYRSSELGPAYITHVQGDGSLAPGWPTNGRIHEPGRLYVDVPILLPDGAGGVFACWDVVEDPALRTTWILAQHYDALGVPDVAWPAGGAFACVETPVGRRPEAMVPDGTGGFYTVWEDYRSRSNYYDSDIYAQRIRGDGTRAPGWPEDGLPVSALPNVTQGYPSLCDDGAGGIYVAWTDHRNAPTEVFISRIGPDGTRRPGWPADGLALNPQPYFQDDPHIVADGMGGVYVTWLELIGGYHVRVQHLSGSGAPAPGWPAGGVRVASSLSQYEPAICTDGAGGAIVGWEDYRGNDPYAHQYAQRFVPDGPVAVTVSLVSADATPSDVRLHWRVIGEAGAAVERRVAEGAWQQLARVTADGEGNLRHTDTDVTPGERYSYRLAFSSGERGGETSVTVPLSLQLALEGARPNPARGAPAIVFTLPAPGPARLELLDVSGRRVASRELVSLGVGRHVLRVDDAPLSPGLYWAVLTHAGRTLRAKVAIVE